MPADFRWLFAWLALGLAIGPLGAAEPEQSPADAVPAKLLRYAQRLVRTYDADGDGRLQPAEWRKMRGDPRKADADNDGVITLDELERYLADYAQRHRLRLLRPPVGAPAEVVSVFTPADDLRAGDSAREAKPAKEHSGTAGAAAGSTPPAAEPSKTPAAPAEPPAAEPSKTPAAPAEPPAAEVPQGTKFYVPPKRLPAGLPDWFRQRDVDGDGQLTLAEYAPRATPSQLAEFARLDANRDGLLTAKEYVRATGAGKSAKPAAKKK